MKKITLTLLVLVAIIGCKEKEQPKPQPKIDRPINWIQIEPENGIVDSSVIIDIDSTIQANQFTYNVSIINGRITKTTYCRYWDDGLMGLRIEYRPTNGRRGHDIDNWSFPGIQIYTY
jgi:hypothetical protein